MEEGGEDLNSYEPVTHNGDDAMNEDDFNQDIRHNSFTVPPRSEDANKWDEEEDWEVQQREEQGGCGGGGCGSGCDVIAMVWNDVEVITYSSTTLESL